MHFLHRCWKKRIGPCPTGYIQLGGNVLIRGTYQIGYIQILFFDFFFFLFINIIGSLLATQGRNCMRNKDTLLRRRLRNSTARNIPG